MTRSFHTKLEIEEHDVPLSDADKLYKILLFNDNQLPQAFEDNMVTVIAKLGVEVSTPKKMCGHAYMGCINPNLVDFEDDSSVGWSEGMLECVLGSGYENDYIPFKYAIYVESGNNMVTMAIKGLNFPKIRVGGVVEVISVRCFW